MSPPRGQQAPQSQLDAPRKGRRGSITFARDHDGARLPRALLKPFRSRPAHIMLLWPIAVRQVPHDHFPRWSESSSLRGSAWSSCECLYAAPRLGSFSASRVNRGCEGSNDCVEAGGSPIEKGGRPQSLIHHRQTAGTGSVALNSSLSHYVDATRHSRHLLAPALRALRLR